MLDYFAEDKPLKDITAGDADLWRIHLINSELSENTVRRSYGVAKQWFHFAVRQLIDSIPFGGFKVALKTNHDRFYFVSREEAAKVLDAYPDAEWRLLFALARFGGLRIPFEALKLRWRTLIGRADASECIARRPSITRAKSRGWCRYSLSCSPTCVKRSSSRLKAPSIASRAIATLP